MDLVVVFGPPASGKLTLARALCEQTGYGLLCGDQQWAPLVSVFGSASVTSAKLWEEFRGRLLEEAVSSGLPGVVMTLAWALDSSAHVDVVAGYCEMVTARGGRVLFAELAASKETRMLRYGAAGPGGRGAILAESMIELDRHFVMNTGASTTAADGLLARHRHERVDTTQLDPDEVLNLVLDQLEIFGAAPAIGS